MISENFCSMRAKWRIKNEPQIINNYVVKIFVRQKRMGTASLR